MPQSIFQFLQSPEGRWVAGGVLALVGVTLWLGGSRFNRGISTLVGVLIGGVVGLELPRWAGWSVSGMGPAVGGAVALGLAGYLLHRVWITLMLGLLLAGVATFIAWHLWGPAGGWAMPTGGDAGVVHRLGLAWHSLPVRFAYLLPVVAGVGLFVGISVGVLWPSSATALMYSLAGVCLLTGLALAFGGGRISRPQWLNGRPETQAAIFAGMVALGVLLQWRRTHRRAATADAMDDDWDEDES